MSDSKALLQYGGVPVPYTAAWSAEEEPGMMYLGPCPYARRVAIRQRHARGDQANGSDFLHPKALTKNRPADNGNDDIGSRSAGQRDTHRNAAQRNDVKQRRAAVAD